MFHFFANKKQKKTNDLTFDQNGAIPHHIAIIMDGNGRWAKKRHLPRVAGHKEGMNNVKRITRLASQYGVKVLTLYAFSTENWKRPANEVNYLMQLPVDFFDTFVPELMKENVKVHVMGEMNDLPSHTQTAVHNAIEKTAQNTGMILNFALNYGSRAEIVSTIQHIAKDVTTNELTVDEITEETVDCYLMTGFLPEQWRNPDLVIRTSGEERISNFLLWQIAYSELYFATEAWPEFNDESFQQALASFQQRNRRFGGLSEEE